MISAQTMQYTTLLIPRELSHCNVRKVIAQGSRSVVLEAIDRESGKDYAVKVMSHEDLKNRNLLEMVQHEILFLQRLTHNDIIHFHEVIPYDELLFIITENHPEGDLLSWVIARRVCDRLLPKQLFYDIVLAVQYLHKQGICSHGSLRDAVPPTSIRPSARRVPMSTARTEVLRGHRACAPNTQ
jgi:serine/threonine protein kinase